MKPFWILFCFSLVFSFHPDTLKKYAIPELNTEYEKAWQKALVFYKAKIAEKQFVDDDGKLIESLTPEAELKLKFHFYNVMKSKGIRKGKSVDSSNTSSNAEELFANKDDLPEKQINGGSKKYLESPQDKEKNKYRYTYLLGFLVFLLLPRLKRAYNKTFVLLLPKFNNNVLITNIVHFILTGIVTALVLLIISVSIIGLAEGF